MRLKSVFSCNFFCTSQKFTSKICIVGAGPAGFYAAQHLLKKLDYVEVDILEKLPVPFGLVRFGVAPDHPEVKNVINSFTKTMEDPRINFYGNITLGQDVTLKQLKEHYNAVLLSYGAEQSRKLEIPGENLENVLQAREIVGWYNGIPWNSNLKIDLSGEKVAIFGQGNVAIDVARILLSPIDMLKKTDITEFALEALSLSKIRQVQLIGRRGPLQAAFTIKELREMMKLPNCKTVWCPNDFDDIHPEIISQLTRPKKRITELMLSSLKTQESGNGSRQIFAPVFYKSPLKLLGNENKVEKVILGRNQLQGDDLIKKNAILIDGSEEEISCNLAVTSIGYNSIPVDRDIPFDEKKGVIINHKGRVVNYDGLYATGWLATGPSGVILSTMSNAFGTAGEIIKDLESSKINNELKEGFEGINKILKRENRQVVRWSDWLKIDKYERDQGQRVGKPREKITDIVKMLEIVA